MPHNIDPRTVTTIEQLESLLGGLSEASLKKEIALVHPHYRALIEASPSVVLATTGPGGLDASSRGEAPGFIVGRTRPRCCCPNGAATTAPTACATSCCRSESGAAVPDPRGWAKRCA